MEEVLTIEKININRKELLEYILQKDEDKLKWFAEIEPWALKEKSFEEIIEFMLTGWEVEFTICGVSKEKVKELFKEKEIKFHYKKGEKVKFVVELNKKEVINILK